ncbi:37S ribosomal protein S5 [Biscogniauxia mediterranea]|nr:37S ribosomal protein S5 [Biscogniauxia mediterranea]
MSVVRPARCLLTRRLVTASQPAAPRCSSAPFHTSTPLANRKPRFKNIRAVELGLINPETVDKFTKENFPAYTPEEMDVLRETYTPEQMAALEAGEAVINTQDITIQGRIRTDPYTLNHLDDFSQIRPIVDKRPRDIEEPLHPESRFMGETEHVDQLEHYLKSMIPRDINFDNMTAQEAERILNSKVNFNMKTAEYFEEGSTLLGHRSVKNNAMAPALGRKIGGIAGMYKPPIDPADEGLDDEGIYQNLKRRTGLTVRDILDIKSKILVTRLVHNQTRLGKVRSMWILAIAGNGNGRLGVGEAKSTEAQVAVLKAKLLAVQNLQPIRRYEERTVFGTVEAKVGATIVKIESRPPGFGLRASHRLFEIFRAVGIHDIAAKMPRGRNPMNSVKACVEALRNQKDPEEIAIGRGKKLVDLRSVYYGGNVL